MSKKVLGFDPGYGDIKESFRDSNGNIVNRKYSSLVAKAPEKATDMPIFEGDRYYTGAMALMQGENNIIDLTDYIKLEKLAPLFLWKTLKDNKINPKELDYIVTGLSFSQIEKSGDFLKRLSKFKVNGETFDFKDKILLAPQGVGAKYAIDYYYPEGPDTYLIIDIGFSTIDVVDIIEGVVRPESVQGFKDEGIIRIARSLQDYIANTYGEVLSLKEVKEALETKELYLEGEDHDLSEVIEKFSKSYTEITFNALKERFSREFKKYRKIYFVGGGAYYIDKNVSKVIEVLPNAEYYNSIGNLLRGEIELEKNKG